MGQALEDHMFDTKIDLAEDLRGKVAKLLNERLADAIDLGAQTKHAHSRHAGVLRCCQARMMRPSHA